MDCRDEREAKKMKEAAAKNDKESQAKSCTKAGQPVRECRRDLLPSQAFRLVPCRVPAYTVPHLPQENDERQIEMTTFKGFNACWQDKRGR